jgi:hypothetical protein
MIHLADAFMFNITAVICTNYKHHVILQTLHFACEIFNFSLAGNALLAYPARAKPIKATKKGQSLFFVSK